MNVRRLAKLCGFSRTTVSRALRDDPVISAATRRKIQSLAGKLSYHPDPEIALQMTRIARGGREERASTLGMLSPWPEKHAWQNNWILEQFHDGIIARAEEIGYRVEEFWLREPGMDDLKLRRILRYRGIRGVVVLNHPESAAKRPLDLAGLSAVALGRTLAQPGLPAIDHDHFRGMNAALHALVGCGHRHIGLALFDDWQERVRTEHQWEAAFALHQQTVPKADRVPVFVGLRDDGPRLAEWYRRHQPAAIVCDYPWGRDLLQQAGAAGAEKVAFACLMWRSAADGCAGVDMNCVEIGRLATDMAHARLGLKSQLDSTASHTTLVAGVWRDGPSVTAR
jgi:LacI family transcriptional regulator